MLCLVPSTVVALIGAAAWGLGLSVVFPVGDAGRTQWRRPGRQPSRSSSATFALIFFGAGAVILNANGQLDLTGVALAHGLVLADHGLGDGAYLRGAVQPRRPIALWVTGKLPTVRAGVLIVAQLAGAIAARVPAEVRDPRGVVRCGRRWCAGSRRQRSPWGRPILIEAITTFFLVFAVFGTAVDDRGPFSKIGGPHDRPGDRVRHLGDRTVHGRRDEPCTMVRTRGRDGRLHERVGLDRRADRRSHHRGRAVLLPVPEGREAATP